MALSAIPHRYVVFDQASDTEWQLEGARSTCWVGSAWQLHLARPGSAPIASKGSSMIAYMVAVRRHVKDDKGASAVEYGLLIAAIAAVIVVIVFALGSVVKSKFQKTCNEVQTGGTVDSSTTCTSP
jgi:pilus assembly protein Flp/PilA